MNSITCETCENPSTQVWDDKYFCETCAWDYWKDCHNNPEIFVFPPTASEMEAIEKELLTRTGAKSKHNKKYQAAIAEYMEQYETWCRENHTAFYTNQKG